MKAANFESVDSGGFGTVYTVDIDDYSAHAQPTLAPAAASGSSSSRDGSLSSHSLLQERQTVWKVLSQSELVPAGAVGIPWVVRATAVEGLPFKRLGAHQGLARALTSGIAYLRVADECINESTWQLALSNMEDAIERAARAHDRRHETCPAAPAMPQEPMGECLRACCLQYSDIFNLS
jgi:hypothetical protein